ncbi:MAG: site-2 protease family protein [Candidatus Omnitrophota bacterium]|jgi:Zn-dependent protease
MNLIGLIISFAFLIVAMTTHEFAHGWVAYKLGDNTAKYSGRLTLNPLAHIDLMGTIILPLALFIATSGRFIFGAAKPVPVNYWTLKNPRRDMMLVGAAGPLANFVFAYILVLAWRFLPPSQLLNFILQNLIYINVVLGVFNLIPIPPLDGSRIVSGLLPAEISNEYSKIEPYGFYIILILVWLNIFQIFVLPVVNLILKIMTAPLLGASF